MSDFAVIHFWSLVLECRTLTHLVFRLKSLFFFLTAVFAEGVTFLALGNGAPDIFSAIAAFSRPHTAGLAVGALFGSCAILLRS